MAVFYKLFQDNRKSSLHPGSWYARAKMTDTVSIEQLAEIMQRNCTVKKADILAVIAELVETMRDQLQSSKRVKLDGFGSFKIGLKTTGAESAAKFSPTTHIQGMRVNFMPEVHIDKNKNRMVNFLTGCKVAELPKNNVDTTEQP